MAEPSSATNSSNAIPRGFGHDVSTSVEWSGHARAEPGAASIRAPTASSRSAWAAQMKPVPGTAMSEYSTVTPSSSARTERVRVDVPTETRWVVVVAGPGMACHRRVHSSPWSGLSPRVGKHSSMPPTSTNVAPGSTRLRAGSGRSHSHWRPAGSIRLVQRPP